MTSEVTSDATHSGGTRFVENRVATATRTIVTVPIIRVQLHDCMYVSTNC